MHSQIKSKERVKKFAEVFTNPREVNAMLDLVKEETQKIETTFLEPSCGTGNFLVEILRRKLEVANNDQERIVALSSIYGVDIQLDNVKTSRLRMLQMMMDQVDWSYLATCIQILNKNIIKGDFLKKMNCQLCKHNCEGKIEPNSKECKFLYRPNERGLKEIISKQKQTISRLREEIRLLKEIKHVEFLKQITKERDALRCNKIIHAG